MLLLQLLEPALLLPGEQVGVCHLCLSQIILGMSQARCLQLSTGLERLQPILPNRLQQLKARTIRVLFGPVEQVLVQK